jgi:hypothetical protein
LAIYRGPGGPGDAINDASSEVVLAVLAKDAALAAQAAAEAAQVAAETAQTAAELAETNAETAETNAETAETNAETAQAAAEVAQAAAEAVLTDPDFVAVVAIEADITTVAGIAADVTTVAGISSDVTAVAADAADIGTVAADIADVSTVAGSIANVNTVATDIASVTTVASDLNEPVSEIETVAGSITNVNTVGGNISNVNTVAGISANVTTVAGISANVTTVATNNANVTTVATNIANVNTVATNIASVNTNATNIANINQNAANITAIQNASANATAAANSATAAASSATSASASAAAASAVALGNEPVRHSVRPSLLLDFANTKTLDPRITFTRGSTATFYDGKTVAKAEENLLLQSQTFDNASWVKSASSITANNTTAPDGTSTADNLIENNTNAIHYTYQTSVSVAGVYTFSCYLKANTRTLAFMYGFNLATSIAYFDLSTGVLGTVSGTGSPSATITSVGNSWYRCTLTATVPANSNFGIGLTTADNTSSYAGDGTSSIYIWGAQLEQRSSVTAYTATTTAPITNYIPALQTAASGVARFEHNPVTRESLGLEIEEQRANLLLQSEDLDTTWSETRATLSLNSRVSPAGTLTADRLIASTDNDTHFTTQTFTGTAVAHTFTVYAKAAGLNHVALRLFNGTSQVGLAYYNLSTGATGTVTAGTASITSVGNGWYRCALTATLAASASCTADIYLASADNTNSFAGNAFDGVSLWGAQLEAGAFATSYIPTTSATVTRSADAASMTGTNFSSWYRADAGTLYGEGSCPNDSVNTDRVIAFINNGTNANGYVIRFAGSTKTSQTYGSNGSAANQWIIEGSSLIGASAKMAVGYAINNVGFAVNNTLVGTDSLAIVGAVNQLNIGQQSAGINPLCGTIKKLAYYPLRLTNSELQGLTTV